MPNLTLKPLTYVSLVKFDDFFTGLFYRVKFCKEQVPNHLMDHKKQL